MRLVSVPPAKTGTAWPFVEQWVEQALKRGNADQSPEDIQRQLDRGGMQLWLIWDRKPVGCLVTEIIESTRGRTCNIVVLGGERFGLWAHLEAEIAQWAREHWGCVRLSLVGRKGWVRRLAGVGWREAAVTLEKVIVRGTIEADAKD